MKVEAFPNPFSQQISVATNFSQAESAEMLLTDMAGHIIFQETITTAAGRQIHQIRPGALAHGMYCLRLRWGQKQWHQILIKN
ncbi:MAG: T9SS type A sorting domain-containing protein [Bacteroidota bacterium]